MVLLLEFKCWSACNTSSFKLNCNGITYHLDAHIFVPVEKHFEYTLKKKRKKENYFLVKLELTKFVVHYFAG